MLENGFAEGCHLYLNSKLFSISILFGYNESVRCIALVCAGVSYKHQLQSFYFGTNQIGTITIELPYAMLLQNYKVCTNDNEPHDHNYVDSDGYLIRPAKDWYVEGFDHMNENKYKCDERCDERFKVDSKKSFVVDTQEIANKCFKFTFTKNNGSPQPLFYGSPGSSIWKRKK